MAVPDVKPIPAAQPGERTASLTTRMASRMASPLRPSLTCKVVEHLSTVGQLTTNTRCV